MLAIFQFLVDLDEREGKIVDAKIEFRRALGEYEKLLGLGSAKTPRLVMALGSVHSKKCNLAEEEFMYYRALG